MRFGKKGDLKGKERGQDLFHQEILKIRGSSDDTRLDKLLKPEGMRIAAGWIGRVIGLQQPKPWIGAHGAWAIAFIGVKMTSGSENSQPSRSSNCVIASS